MPRDRRRFFRNAEEDRFETEALANLNEEEDSESENEQESGNGDSEPEAEQEKPETESDDEAPEDIGFQDSRQSILSQLRSATRQVEAEKQEKKAKRRQLDAQLKEQKAKKRKLLDNSKLPQDFLENIKDVIPKQNPTTSTKRYPDGRKRRVRHTKEKTITGKKNKNAGKTQDISESSEDAIPKQNPTTSTKRYPDGRKRRVRHAKEKTITDSSPEEKKNENKEKEKNSSPIERKNKNKKNEKSEKLLPERSQNDYISFTDRSSGVQVADFKFVEKQSKSAVERAKAFKQSRLYDRDIGRESNEVKLAIVEKRRHRLR